MSVGVDLTRPTGTTAGAKTLFARLGALPLLALALIVAIILGGAIGSVAISPWDTARILLNATHIMHFTPTWSYADEQILLYIRLPRVLGGVLAGAALGLSGTLFQGLLRNPLADPFLLGASAGAALGATVAFMVPALFAVTWLGFSLVEMFAFIGALVAVVIVYRLATRRGQTPVVTLLLAGVAVSAIFTAAQTLLLSLDTRLGLHLNSLYTWITGAITVQSWSQVQVVTLLLIPAIVAAIWLAPTLDAFALGEDMAAHLGIAVERRKLIIVGLASLLVALAVSLSGLVGFVGLVAPHLCRILMGPRHRLLLPASALVGGTFIVLADMLARSIAPPIEAPLGVVTALVGGPFFLALLYRAGARYQW